MKKYDSQKSESMGDETENNTSFDRKEIIWQTGDQDMANRVWRKQS